MYAAAVTAVLALAACAGEEPRSAPAPTGASTPATPTEDPTAALVLDQDFPDPDVLRAGDEWYAYATQPADNSPNVSMARSADLMTWEPAAKDPLPRLPAWATNGRTWAPDVSAVKRGFVMYFTARSVTPDLQCIGVATGTRPAGPFRPVGRKPLVCPEKQGGAIDPASFVDTDGTRYLLWKNDGNCCGKDTWLHLQKMSADGTRVAGPARRLVKQDLPWEGDLVEAPTLVRRGSSYVLFYSANSYAGEQYATGYAVADRIEGPYRKSPEPLMTTDAVGVIGPGGQDVVTAQDGSTRIVFHGWDEAVVKRGMYVAPLRWEGMRPVAEGP